MPGKILFTFWLINFSDYGTFDFPSLREICVKYSDIGDLCEIFGFLGFTPS